MDYLLGARFDRTKPHSHPYRDNCRLCGSNQIEIRPRMFVAVDEAPRCQFRCHACQRMWME